MFDPGGVGEWSPPQSPFGGFRGKKRESSHLAMVYSSLKRAKRRLSLQPKAELPDSISWRAA